MKGLFCKQPASGISYAITGKLYIRHAQTVTDSTRLLFTDVGCSSFLTDNVAQKYSIVGFLNLGLKTEILHRDVWCSVVLMQVIGCRLLYQSPVVRTYVSSQQKSKISTVLSQNCY